MEQHSLNIAVIGCGLGGLSAAIALRQAGHNVTIYERDHTRYELGSGIGVVSNATKWLEGEWGVDFDLAKALVCERAQIHDWKTGKIMADVSTGDYNSRFGHNYYMCYRADLHKALLERALAAADAVGSAGQPALLKQDHRCVAANAEEGTCTFSNGVTIQADLVVGADGIHSQIRNSIGITPEVKPSTSCCYRFIVRRSKLESLELSDVCDKPVISMWGGRGTDKVVWGPSHNFEVLTAFAFFPAERAPLCEDGWDIPASPAELANTFPDIDPTVRAIMLSAEDVKIWRLFEHQPYPYRHKGKACLIGDAAAPMMPDQNQGFSMAVEDAAALNLVLSQETLTRLKGDLTEALRLYEELRSDRVRIVQEKSLKARTDVRERFGFATPQDPPGKLTAEWLCEYDMRKHLQELLDRSEIEQE